MSTTKMGHWLNRDKTSANMPRDPKEARLNAGLSASEAAALVGVTTVTWQRWEGQTSRATEIPYAHWNLFLLLTDRHPVYLLVKKDGA